MTAIQSNKLAMYHAVRVFLTALLSSTTATSAFPALAAKLATLITLIDKIIAAVATQEEPLRGHIRARDQALADAMEATFAIAGPVLSYARSRRMPDLVANVRVNASAFRRLRRAERMRIAQRVHDAAEPIIAELADYGLTPAKLAEFQAKIDATQQAVNVPRSTAVAKRAATVELTRLFADADALLAEIDPMLAPLRLTDRETHAAYVTARQVLDRPGTRSISEPPAAAPSATAAPAPADKLAA